METEQRSYEIRLQEDPDRLGPGVLEGVLMPYEQRAADRPEMFAQRALHWPQGGVVLREQHNRQAPIARFAPIRDENELRVRIPLPDTQRGRDAAENVRNGTLRGLSVEFVAEKETQRDGVRFIQQAKLVGAGLVDDPSYAAAKVEVRQGENKRRRVWL